MVYWLTRSWSVHFSHDVGHARLVGNEGSEMNGFGWIILGESLYLAPVSLTPLLGQKAKRAVTRCRELTMWLKWTCFSITLIWLQSYFPKLLHYKHAIPVRFHFQWFIHTRSIKYRGWGVPQRSWIVSHEQGISVSGRVWNSSSLSQ